MAAAAPQRDRGGRAILRLPLPSPASHRLPGAWCKMQTPRPRASAPGRPIASSVLRRDFLTRVPRASHLQVDTLRPRRLAQGLDPRLPAQGLLQGSLGVISSDRSSLSTCIGPPLVLWLRVAGWGPGHPQLGPITQFATPAHQHGSWGG